MGSPSPSTCRPSYLFFRCRPKNGKTQSKPPPRPLRRHTRTIEHLSTMVRNNKLSAKLLAALVVATILSSAPSARADGLGDLCGKDPELAKIAAENPQVAQCCSQFDTLLSNIDAVLAQGVTALVPIMGCTTLPPIELSANCYNEMNVLVGFFNASGLLSTATDAATSGNISEEAISSIPTEDEFKKMALDYLPTSQKDLEAITGSPNINPVCCESIRKLVTDKCACEEKPMSFLNTRLDEVGLDISSYLDLAKTVVSTMGCDGAADLEVYPNCKA